LYDKISAWSQGNTGKSKMGYAAKTYESIFEALEKAMAAAYE
jgi:hypothetical protein